MSGFLVGMSNIFSFPTFPILVMGVFGGIVIGALPGLTSTMGVALLLPLTYGMDAKIGIIMLIGIYCGAIYGGSISACLLNTPGTPASAATTLDGYPMAKRGEGARALTISTISSGLGGIISGILLISIAPTIAKVALKFGATEFFALAVFGLCMIVSMSAGAVAKGLCSGFLGILLATVGLDDITNTTRFTFGNANLVTGFELIPAMIGLFAISQVFLRIENPTHGVITKQKKYSSVPSKSDMKVILTTSTWSGIIGTIIGAIPGTGGDIAAFVSYNIAKRTSRNPEKFGTGYAQGISAPESANNGTTGGTLIPLLTLSVPGDSTTAVLLGAFTLQGLQTGPLLFTMHRELVDTIFVGFMISNILLLILGLSLMRFYVKTLSVRDWFITPAILVLCVVGSYAINKSLFDVFVMFCFGILGYFLIKLKVPLSPIVLAFILCPLAERNFRRALLISAGDYSVFFNRPLTVVLFALSIFFLVLPFFKPAFQWVITHVSRKSANGDE